MARLVGTVPPLRTLNPPFQHTHTHTHTCHTLAVMRACPLAGNASPGMHAFLTGSMGEHGLRRLAKVIDGAVQTVQAALLDQVGA
jgi:hypothetical protein